MSASSGGSGVVPGIHPANARAFADRPAFRERLAAAPPSWTLQPSRSGLPVPVRSSDGKWLLSRYDPRRETERWVAAQALADDELPVFIGFQPYLLEACRVRPIVIVEKDASLAACILGGMELGPRLDGVSLVLDETGFAMMSAVRNVHDVFRHRRMRFLPLPSCEDASWVRAVLEHGVKIQRETSLNAISYSVQLPRWIAATRANLASMMQAPDGRALYGILPGRTAVVVGAGPSLDRNIGALARDRDRVLVIAVDTALRRLENAGIVPDIAVAVDANAANARDVDRLGAGILEQSILAADPIASPEVVRAFRGLRTFLRSINFTFDLEGRAVPMVEPLDVLLHDLAGRNVIAAWQSGGSVSTNAFNLCHLMGMSRVILVGQDLAFTGGRPHSSGVGHEDEHAERHLGRFLPREMFVRMATRDAEWTVPGWSGGTVRTNEVLREYLNWFEMTMEHGFGRMFAEVVDATEGGAAKKGMARMTLEEALRATPPGGDVAAIVRSRLQSAEPAGLPGWERRVQEFVRKLRGLAGAPPDRVMREIPLARWIVLPAWVGSFDMDPDERRAVQEAGIASSVDFLLKVFAGLADELATDAGAAHRARPSSRPDARAARTEEAGDAEIPGITGLHVARAGDGSPALAVASGSGVRFLDDAAAPSRAAERRVADAAARGTPMLLILGIGLGYELEAAVARADFEAIVVIEPARRAMARARERGGVTAALADPRVLLLDGLGPDEVFRRLATRFDRGLEDGRQLVVLPRSTRLVHAELELDRSTRASFEQRLDALAVLSERNVTTLSRFAEPWRRHILANLPAILESGRVAELAGMARNVPAILLGAGPSLDRVLGPLRDALEAAARSDRAARPLVCVVDTALKAVAAAGIRPDIVVAVDASEENLRDFDGVDIDQERTALVYVPVVHPAIPGLFRRRYAASYGHPVQVWIEEVTGKPFGSLSISGSVSTLGYDLLRMMGARPIILAGMDLAVGETAHTRGALDGRGDGRFRTTETRAWRHARSATVARPGWGGGVARTTEQMDRWVEWFEAELVRRPWPTINATGGGARIAGTTERTMAEALLHAAGRSWELPEPRTLPQKARARIRRALEVAATGAAEAEPLLAMLLSWDLCVAPRGREARIRHEFRDRIADILGRFDRR